MGRRLIFTPPAPLSSNHLVEHFDCGKASLNDWLIRHARQAQASGSAKTFVAANQENRVVGYFSLTVGQIDTLQVPERIRKGMGRYPIPVVLLGRLAVDSGYQGKGIGAGLLRNTIRRALTISEQAGVRAMMTHPIRDKASGFYRGFGFVESPSGGGQLLLLPKDARKVASSFS